VSVYAEIFQSSRVARPLLKARLGARAAAVALSFATARSVISARLYQTSGRPLTKPSIHGRVTNCGFDEVRGLTFVMRFARCPRAYG
jgi:hypothetical protein